MIESIFRFFRPDIFFSLRSTISTKAMVALLVFFAVVVLVAVIIKIWQFKKQPDKLTNILSDKYFNLLLAMGLIGFIYVWFRYERVYFLSGRFWLVVWLATFLVWLGFIWRYQYRTVPELKSKKEQKERFEKYLPKGKNKKYRK